MKEIWKPVVGYEGLYEVSSEGRVRSLDHIVVDTKGVTRHRKGKVLKPSTTKFGYLRVTLMYNGLPVHKLIHRLVCESFIPNPDNLPQVNHKDECKINNNVDNLEWCTSKYNNNYGYHNQNVIDGNIESGHWDAEHVGLPKKVWKHMWYEEHKEEILAKYHEHSKELYEKRKEYYSEYHKKYDKEHREEKNRRLREWRARQKLQESVQ